MFTQIDPMNPVHRAALGSAVLIGVILAVLIADVLIPGLVALQIGGAP